MENSPETDIALGTLLDIIIYIYIAKITNTCGLTVSWTTMSKMMEGYRPP